MIKYLPILFTLSFTGCYSSSKSSLYPESVPYPVYKVGQRYISKINLAFDGDLLSKWQIFYNDSKNFQKVPTGTKFEIVKVDKSFSGTFGRKLDVWVKFNHNSNNRVALLSIIGVSKKLSNIDNYEVYLVPDPSKATLIE